MCFTNTRSYPQRNSLDRKFKQKQQKSLDFLLSYLSSVTSVSFLTVLYWYSFRSMLHLYESWVTPGPFSPEVTLVSPVAKATTPNSGIYDYKSREQFNLQDEFSLRCNYVWNQEPQLRISARLFVLFRCLCLFRSFCLDHLLQSYLEQSPKLLCVKVLIVEPDKSTI